MQGLLPTLGLPFTTTTVDRSPPVVLEKITDIGEFRAASGNYQVLVDIETDTRFVPSFIKGERALLVGLGRVDAGVDLSRLDASAIRVAQDVRTVRVTLPPVVLFPPRLDVEQSYVSNRNRGLIDRATSPFRDSPTSDGRLYAAAQERLAAAARVDGALIERARENTRAMVADLFGRAGFARVEVAFSPASAA